VSPLAPPADWVAPGAVATLVWHEGALDRADGARAYQIAGPVLEPADAGPLFLLCPERESGFAERVYDGQASSDDLRAFLGGAALAHGRVEAGGEWLAVRAEAPVLPLLAAWDVGAPPPLVPYEREIAGFLPGDALLHVSPEAHARAAAAAERFATAWVCEECGDARDAAVFLWTRRDGDRVRVRLLVDNQAGLWRCHLQPFAFAREAA
jgi:hypothetical protein